MLSIFNSLFKRHNKQPRYRLHDKWEPSFDSELKLAVESFHADEAFHRAFGEDELLDKKAILWCFIDLVMSRRANEGKHFITVRKNKTLAAFTAGSLTCGATLAEEFSPSANTSTNKEASPALELVEHQSYNSEEHQCVVAKYDAVENKQLTFRLKQYNKLLTEYGENNPDAPWHFSIHMIAVALNEQGEGHLRAMLDKLASKFQALKLGDYIQVSTYDQSKAELYEHLGFTMADELENNDTKAWVLKMPLAKHEPTRAKKKLYQSSPKASIR